MKFTLSLAQRPSSGHINDRERESWSQHGGFPSEKTHYPALAYCGWPVMWEDGRVVVFLREREIRNFSKE